MEDLESREFLILGGVFVVATMAGVFLGLEMFGSNAAGEPGFTSFTNVTVDAENNIREVDFDGRSISLLYEDSQEAKFYIDKDQDGSFDFQLTNTTHDGEVRTTQQAITFNRTTYRFRFRYKDDAEKEDDGYLTLFQIREIG